MTRRGAAIALSVMLGTACGRTAPSPQVRVAPEPPSPASPTAPKHTAVAPREPVLPPQLALLAGLMPLRSIGADTFRVAHPTYDGRGVIIAILDSGIDAGVPGLSVTTTGERKLLDLRDFSGEGRVPLEPVEAGPDGSLTIRGYRLSGFGRMIRVAAPPYYAGLLREVSLGNAAEADVNGNGISTDEFPIVVGKASGGWVAMTDTDGDGSLANETPIQDFAIGGETFTYRVGAPGREPNSMTIAVNFAEQEKGPLLDLVMDNSSHGTHVAGIAAGHNMFGVEGFDGVAPGARLLGLKISNNARGGGSVTGSMLRAMNYAADFAARRALPLIINLSFGVGNELEGAAAIDSLINEFALKHPDVLFVISAGNDGPGLSTVGFPGSAAHALSVCALFPGVFASPPEPGVRPPSDVLGWWSGRGGEVAKPDVCAPGVAFSNVPPWSTGEEVSGGTSMAAPHASGAAALLLSAMGQQGRVVRAVDLKRAVMATATPLRGATVLDEGSGVIVVTAAYRWLLAAHQTGVYEVQALTTTGDTPVGTAAYRRSGLAGREDTIQRFAVNSVGGQPAARLLLDSDAPWLHAPKQVELQGRPETVTVTYDAARLRDPGVYVGTVWARSATDTIAGPAFRLSNTVIVPHQLDLPLRTADTLLPGAVARHFVMVPRGAGGLTVRLRVPDASQQASVYLFEPSGQPFRGGGSAAVGGRDSTETSIVVTADDLVPGVYEAVVVAPPASPTRFELEAALPEVAITAIAAGPAVELRNVTQQPISAEMSARVIGAARWIAVRGRGSTPDTIRIHPPSWAARLVVDVRLPTAVWNRVTDFGVTLYDSTGRKVSDGLLNYAFGRQRVKLDSTLVGSALDIELFPGFAHFEPPDEWTADVRVTFEAGEPISLSAAATGPPASVQLPPGASRLVSLDAMPLGQLPVPPGYALLLDVAARPMFGPAAIRRGTPAPGD